MTRACQFAAFLWLAWCCVARAQVTYTGMTTADAFLPTGSAANPAGTDLTGKNFGAAGTLVIAPPTSAKGEFQSVLKFNFADAVALFNSTYGANGWTITDISLELTSNYGTGGVQPNNGIFDVINGGKFVVEWLSENDWVEGTGTPSLPTTDGVTYDSLPTLLAAAHEIVSTNIYFPPGDDVHTNYPLSLNPQLVADIAAGGDVSLLLYAADNQVDFLFNSRTYGRGNEPLIHVTASPLAAPPPLQITFCYWTNGFFVLNGIGGKNLEYDVQAASNPAATDWQTIGTVSSDATGAIQFIDTNAPTHEVQFYRLFFGNQ